MQTAGLFITGTDTGVGKTYVTCRIAREMRSYPGVSGFSKVLLALGDSDEPSRAWPDALSASAPPPSAAIRRNPRRETDRSEILDETIYERWTGVIFGVLLRIGEAEQHEPREDGVDATTLTTLTAALRAAS